MTINVRISLDAFDFAHPAEQQMQVYVEISEVARVSWLLPAAFYGVLKSEPWPHIVDSAQEHYVQQHTVSDSDSAAARRRVLDWLAVDENHDAMHAAWERAEARRNPVARRLLEENERLRARVTELETEHAKLIRWHAEDGKQLAKGHGLLSERTRELIAMEADRNAWKARVAELEAAPLAWAHNLDAADLHPLVGELSAALLGYWQNDPDAAVLGRVAEVLARNRVDLAPARHPAHPAPCRIPDSPDCTCGPTPAATPQTRWEGATEIASEREILRAAATGLVGYWQNQGRFLHCLAHKPAPASRYADFHEVTADDLDDGGVCVHPRCGRDLLANWPAPETGGAS